MEHFKIINIFKETGALMSGHFKLSSGLHSSQYLQCARVLQYPDFAEELCAALAERFKYDDIDMVIGPAFGGIIVAYEVGRALGRRAIFAERAGAEQKMTLRRNFEIQTNESCLVVEDVITTGKSVKEVIDLVRDEGGIVAGVGAIVDRTNCSVDLGVRCESLIKLNIETFSPDKCLLCKEGIELTKPGSRLES